MTPSVRLPGPRTQTAAWVAIASVATVAFLSRWPLTQGVEPSTVAVMAVVAAGASALEVEARARVLGRDVQQVISFTEAALVLLLLTVPPGWAWALTLSGHMFVQIVRRWNPLRQTFNAAVMASSLAAGVAVHELAAPATEELGLRTVVAVAAAVLVHLCINVTGVTAVVIANTGGRLGRGLAVSAAFSVYEAAITLSMGLTAAALWQVQPWLLPVVGVIGLFVQHGFRQVIALRGAWEQSRVQQSRLEEVVAATEHGFVVVDHDGAVTLWNAAAETLTGIEADDALGKGLDDVLGGALRDDAGAALLSGPAVGAGDQGRTAGWLSGRGGSRRRVDVRRVAQHDLVGRRVGEVVQIRDLSTRYELDRLQDDFLSRVSHELRTPLTTIIGFAHTLQQHRTRLSSEEIERLEQGVLTRSKELTGLIDDLLRVARSDFGSGAQGTTVPLMTAVETSVDTARRQWPEHRIIVHEEADPLLDADLFALEEIVGNLLSNACKFSPVGSFVDVHVRAAAHGAAVVEVVDRGRGIPRSQQAEIFERFTRTEDPMLMETRGTGIGLHTVRRFVEALGGSVTVDSAPGAGSTFTVEIPLSRSGVGRGRDA